MKDNNKCFHTIKYKCIYEKRFTQFANKEIVNLTNAGKSMNLYQ